MNEPTTAELEKLRDEHCRDEDGDCAACLAKGSLVAWPCWIATLAAEVLEMRGALQKALDSKVCPNCGKVRVEVSVDQRSRAIRAEIQRDEAVRTRLLTARQAWEDGYQACREGQQRHNPFRVAGDLR